MKRQDIVQAVKSGLPLANREISLVEHQQEVSKIMALMICEQILLSFSCFIEPIQTYRQINAYSASLWLNLNQLINMKKI